MAMPGRGWTRQVHCNEILINTKLLYFMINLITTLFHSFPDPNDQNGHGSHCAGIAVGRANGIGVAPEAKWIACRGLNGQGQGKESNLIKCGQFMLTANPLPNVVSNSWGGRTKKTFYNDIIKAWKGAGIIPVFSIGNNGPKCRTTGYPGNTAGVISVGSTTNGDGVSKFSSRGPADSGMKPEVSAPGSEIVSSGPIRNGYFTLSGTSQVSN